MPLSRRSLFAAPLAFALPRVGFAAVPQRAAVADWALMETMLALGIAPLAGVELVLFRQIAVEPAVPDTVADLGLRGSINFEYLALLDPDVIYGSNYTIGFKPFFERIAPVREHVVYVRGEDPYPKAAAALRAVADDFDLSDAGAAYARETEAIFAALSQRLRACADRPVLLANLGDARHFRAFGDDSMFGSVVRRLGFANAWGPVTSYSATAPVSIEAIADMADAILVVIGPVPPDAQPTLRASALWRALPPVAEGRTMILDPINPFGGLPAARRFARLFAEGLEALP